MNSDSSVTLESMAKADWYNKWLLSKFAPFLSGDILEVGCGIGNFTKNLTEYGKVWAIDIDQEYITKTKQNKEIDVGFGDIEKGTYFFRSKQFDSIVCLNVLEHIKDDAKALNNLHKLLKSKGKLILLLPAHPILYGKIDAGIGHYRRYSKSDIRQKLERVDFKILKFRRLNLLGALGWFIAGKILKNAAVKKSSVRIFNILAPLLLKVENFVEPPFGISFLTVAKKK